MLLKELLLVIESPWLFYFLIMLENFIMNAKHFSIIWLSFFFFTIFDWFLFRLGQVLSPAPTQLLQPMSSSQKVEGDKLADHPEKGVAVGATWSNSGSLKIDLDNLLTSGKFDKNIAPTMNQMASNPTSPTNQPKSMTQTNMSFAPTYGNHPAQNYQQNFATFNQPNNQFFASFKW